MRDRFFYPHKSFFFGDDDASGNPVTEESSITAVGGKNYLLKFLQLVSPRA